MAKNPCVCSRTIRPRKSAWLASCCTAGEAKRALGLTEEAIVRAGLDQAALAVHELALRANSDPRAERLADYERHVQIFDLEPPPGFSTMAEFNARP